MMRACGAPTAPVGRQAPSKALRHRHRSRRPPTRCLKCPHRAQAASWGGDEGNKDEWRQHGKQIVEALTRGSSLARAASVWFVDRRSDSEGASTSATASTTAAFTSPSSIERFHTAQNSEVCLQVDARRESLPRRALAHPESRENREVREALEQHLASGGATVLLAPIVDPLIVDLSADAERDARATFDEDFSSMDILGSFSTFEKTWTSTHSTETGNPDVFVEGTACACDPNDPGDCCARGLSEYCTTCPTLVSMDESLDGLGGDALQVGSSVDHGAGDVHFSTHGNLSPLRSTDALESLEVLQAACERATASGDCAFSKAIKHETSKRKDENGRTYYAAVVKTGVDSGIDSESISSSSSDALDGYELFLVYRPNGDKWVAGVVPPPTTVRRAQFGPKLRGELWSLARRGGEF